MEWPNPTSDQGDNCMISAHTLSTWSWLPESQISSEQIFWNTITGTTLLQDTLLLQDMMRSNISHIDATLMLIAYSKSRTYLPKTGRKEIFHLQNEADVCPKCPLKWWTLSMCQMLQTCSISWSKVVGSSSTRSTLICLCKLTHVRRPEIRKSLTAFPVMITHHTAIKERYFRACPCFKVVASITRNKARPKYGPLAIQSV